MLSILNRFDSIVIIFVTNTSDDVPMADLILHKDDLDYRMMLMDKVLIKPLQ